MIRQGDGADRPLGDFGPQRYMSRQTGSLQGAVTSNQAGRCQACRVWHPPCRKPTWPAGSAQHRRGQGHLRFLSPGVNKMETAERPGQVKRVGRRIQPRGRSAPSPWTIDEGLNSGCPFQHKQDGDSRTTGPSEACWTPDSAKGTERSVPLNDRRRAQFRLSLSTQRGARSPRAP
jgi:hypothetical protein